MKAVAIILGLVTFILLIVQIYTGTKSGSNNAVLHTKYIWIIILIFAIAHVLLGVSQNGI